jgi:hypothetical protein
MIISTYAEKALDKIKDPPVEGRRIKRESGGMSEYDQSTSYSCMKVEK